MSDFDEKPENRVGSNSGRVITRPIPTALKFNPPLNYTRPKEGFKIISTVGTNNDFMVLQISGTSTWVTVVSVSDWYDDVFQNWWFWYSLLDLKMPVIVIAEDEITFEKYKDNPSFKVIANSLKKLRKVHKPW